MAVSLNVDFWHIEGEASTPEALTRILTACRDLDVEDPRRLLDRDTKMIRLQEIENRAGLWFGDFVGIHTRSAAKRGDIHGHMESIEFSEDEGLCEETAFLVVPQLSVILLQRNRMGASSSSVIDFFERIYPEQAMLDFLPIPSQDTMEHFYRFRKITSVTVGLARPENVQAFASNGDSVRNLLRFAAELEAPRLTIQASVGHQWATKELSRNAVTGFFQRMLRIHDVDPGVNLEKARVSGRNEDDERDVLDLVLDRVKEVIVVDADEGRGASRATRWRALRDAYGRQQEFLRDQYEVSAP